MAAPHQENRQAGQKDIYQRWIRRQGRKTIRTLESRIKKLEIQFEETRENIEKIKAQRERMIQHFSRRSNRRARVIQRAQVLQNQQENSENGGGGGAPPPPVVMRPPVVVRTELAGGCPCMVQNEV